MKDNGWNEWSRHVLAELRRLNEELAAIEEQLKDIKGDEISSLKIEIAKLKVKSGVWGLIGGAIPIAVMIGAELVFK